MQPHDEEFFCASAGEKGNERDEDSDLTQITLCDKIALLHKKVFYAAGKEKLWGVGRTRLRGRLVSSPTQNLIWIMPT